MVQLCLSYYLGWNVLFLFSLFSPIQEISIEDTCLQEIHIYENIC